MNFPIRAILRRFATCVALSTPCALSLTAHAQTPLPDNSQPLRIVVPAPAGTASDVLARNVATHLPAALGRPVIVDNRPGAAGNIAMQHVISAAPDGLTLVLALSNHISINPLIYEKQKIDPLNDLKPVASLMLSSYLLVARPGFPYDTPAKLIAAAKAAPDSITYASNGNGSLAHVCMEQLQSATGVRLRHVPYKSIYMSDLIAGHVDIALENPGTSTSLIEQKKLLPIATSRGRLAKLPDVPAFSESVPGFTCSSWSGIMAPRGVPEKTRQYLNEAITKIVRSPEFAALADTLGSTAAPMDLAQTTDAIHADIEKWGRIVPPLGLKLD